MNVMRLAVASIALFGLTAIGAGEALGLDIQVAPQTLVVSSGGGNVTIHTDYRAIPNEEVSFGLTVTPAGGIAATVPITDVFLDDCGFYVVRCDRQAAAKAVGPFEGKRTTATFRLCVESTSGDGGCGEEAITVRK